MIEIDRYQISAQIYESPNSLVYRGIQQQNNQSVILKILKQDYPTPAELTRYKQEYEILRHLNLPGVIKAYTQQKYQKTLVIIFEDFGGNSLKKLLENSASPRSFPSVEEFLSIAIETSDILGQIHAANVIHKDINPANIVFNPETGQLKIIDFGIASVLTRENPTLKNPDILEGTLAYISPEQTGRMNRSLDYRTDFYSLGVTFYELLTKQLPFASNDALELVHCHIAKQPVPPHQINPEIPLAVSNIVMRLMAKTAEERYQSAFGIKADLEQCLRQLHTKGNISPFSLGYQDISDQFHIPQKLYGREAEVETLLTAFERVAHSRSQAQPGNEVREALPPSSEALPPSSEALPPLMESEPHTQAFPDRAWERVGGVEMMLVAGYSGIGKSSLVAEIHKPNTRLRGYFTEGKFDQFQRNIPYSAVVSAFKRLVRQLLTENEAQLNLWRTKLLAAFGVNGQVIIDVIPEVELIVGKQPVVPELGPTESQNRFNLVFGNFIRAFCTQEHPLVIFLDDLQWADSATLKLIELIMMDTETQYLFLIGAYRDNEVSPTHPFIMTVDGLRKQGAIVNQITLAPLKIEHTSQLIADTLYSDIESVKPLAELVQRKTLGNPFFTNQFLKTLYAENLITFHFPQSSLTKKKLQNGFWQWDIANIEAQDITDNVVELMIGKLKKLPDSTQQVLQLAACVGAYFDLDTISIVCEQSKEAIFPDLKTTIQSGLILPTSELDEELLIQTYKFLHDRVQQAAYALIDEDQKQAVHLQIGRLLLQNTAPEMLSEKIFEIVDHLNLGIELLSDQNEREEIAKLNLSAGQKAKAAAAYEASEKYLNVGLQLLSSNSWQDSYELTLSLYEEAAEAAYLNGDFEQMEQLAIVVQNCAKTVPEKVKVYDVKIQAAVSQGNLKAAIKIGLQVLSQLGMNLSEEPSKLDVQRALEETAKLWTESEIEDLINLPEMTDPEKLADMHILSSITAAAYVSAPELFALIALSKVQLSIKYGNATWSAFGYVLYGIVLCGIVEDIEPGYKFGCLALSLMNRLNAKQVRSKICEVFGAHVMHWKKPFRETLPFVIDGYQSGVETGDFEFAGFCAFYVCGHSYFMGHELIGLEQKMRTYSHAISQIRRDVPFNWNATCWQGVLTLLGQADSYTSLTGEAYNEERAKARAIAANERSELHYLYLNKLILCYLFGDYQRAVENAVLAEQYLDGVRAMIVVSVFYFYDSLAHLGGFAELSTLEKEVVLNRVNYNQQKMQKWSHHAPANCLHKFDLIEAEKSRVLGQYWQAAQCYEQAIKAARENEFIQEEALAYELAAKFYYESGMEKVAETYIKEAHYAYTRWGAKAKVEDLEAKYPNLLSKSLSKNSITNTLVTTSTSTGYSLGESLDLATVMKASQAISGEIMLDRLLASLMKIMIENAGAQTGHLILEREGKWLIEASGKVDSSETGEDAYTTRVLQSIEIENHLPISIINYVSRTRQTVVKNDAANQGKFTPDPYIKAHQTKSILCAPLLYQGELVGIVYLENNLIQGAFTPSRLEVLQLLAGQAAISIENARLYQTLEDKVKERTAELATANQEISALNNRLRAENIRLSAELEVTKQLQQMILPDQEELEAIEGLEIVGYMEPADEVGGDYYDVLQQNGRLKISIGDVTGHGLESGVLMLMTQTAVRTLQECNLTDSVQFMDILNRTIYGNIKRMKSYKNLTLALLDYSDGTITLSGQHEEMIVIRAGGKVERIDTMALGFPIGLEQNIADFIATEKVHLNPGDVVVLYTDGITEAENINREQYGLERLMEIVSRNYEKSAREIKQAVIEDVRRYIGSQKVFDDITLVVIKQK
jgi:predicted ATPase/serine phosphatase RsbU (regulator of sigma subunit)/tRNA A-37 threonylcarbamoyl transferase component Bud32